MPTFRDLSTIPHPDAPTKHHLHAIVRLFDHGEAYPIAYAMFEQLEGRRDDHQAMQLLADVWAPFGSLHMWTGTSPTQPWEVIGYGEQGDEGRDALFLLAVNGWEALRRWDEPAIKPPAPQHHLAEAFIVVAKCRRRKRSSRR